MLRFVRTLFLTLATPIFASYDTTFISLPTSTTAQLVRRRLSDTTSTINQPQSSIIGGEETAGDNEFPWFGRTDITFSNSFESFIFTCIASLIHSDIVVSAAHCIVDSIREYPNHTYTITFIFGANQYDGSDGDVLEVEKIIYPDDYDFPANDIVFYKLRTSTSISPVPWNTDPSVPKVDDIGTAIRFGLMNGRSEPTNLLKVNLPVISNEKCKTFHPDVPDMITCVDTPGENKDICNGDSGGPILTQNGVLYGITSFGSDTCGSAPFGFTRTSSFSAYISKVICDNSKNPPASCTAIPVANPNDNPDDDAIDGMEGNGSCGLFGLSLFCPFRFGGRVSRLLSAIFGF